jgi:hypothetical protein
MGPNDNHAARDYGPSLCLVWNWLKSSINGTSRRLLLQVHALNFVESNFSG